MARPILTGIMPTRGRQPWAKAAVSGFFTQQWDGEKHLIVVDDADNPSFKVPADLLGDVTYVVMDERLKIGQKRNMAATIADADAILMHIDSDDWSDPRRAEFEFGMLEESQKAVAGFHRLLFFDETTRKVYRLNGPAQQCGFGTTLLYRRTWWEQHPFNEQVTLGEDNRFVAEARESNQLITASADRLMVARIHPNNTGPKVPQLWESASVADLPSEFPI
jgi:hypothetical protein